MFVFKSIYDITEFHICINVYVRYVIMEDEPFPDVILHNLSLILHKQFSQRFIQCLFYCVLIISFHAWIVSFWDYLTVLWLIFLSLGNSK